MCNRVLYQYSRSMKPRPFFNAGNNRQFHCVLSYPMHCDPQRVESFMRSKVLGCESGAKGCARQQSGNRGQLGQFKLAQCEYLYDMCANIRRCQC
jgi:hypothetical protein